jgi:hypothetical protein
MKSKPLKPIPNLPVPIPNSISVEYRQQSAKDASSFDIVPAGDSQAGVFLRRPSVVDFFDCRYIVCTQTARNKSVSE